jgi:hypothetical protein
MTRATLLHAVCVERRRLEFGPASDVPECLQVRCAAGLPQAVPGSSQAPPQLSGGCTAVPSEVVPTTFQLSTSQVHGQPQHLVFTIQINHAPFPRPPAVLLRAFSCWLRPAWRTTPLTAPRSGTYSRYCSPWASSSRAALDDTPATAGQQPVRRRGHSRRSAWLSARCFLWPHPRRTRSKRAVDTGVRRLIRRASAARLSHMGVCPIGVFAHSSCTLSPHICT